MEMGEPPVVAAERGGKEVQLAVLAGLANSQANRGEVLSEGWVGASVVYELNVARRRRCRGEKNVVSLQELVFRKVC